MNAKPASELEMSAGDERRRRDGGLRISRFEQLTSFLAALILLMGYFMWSRPSLMIEFDRALLRRAGAETEKREILKFIPPPLENRLAKRELEYARAHGHDSIESVVKTVFTNMPDVDGFEFVVTAQRYRKRG